MLTSSVYEDADGIKSLVPLFDQEEAVINKEHARICRHFINYDISDNTVAVDYWYEQLEAFDQFKEATHIDTLKGISVELLNSVTQIEVSYFSMTKLETIALYGGKTQWLLDQKGLCIDTVQAVNALNTIRESL